MNVDQHQQKLIMKNWRFRRNFILVRNILEWRNPVRGLITHQVIQSGDWVTRIRKKGTWCLEPKTGEEKQSANYEKELFAHG